MMVSVGVYVRRWRRIVRSILQDSRAQALIQAVAWGAAGFFLSAAGLGNRPQPLVLGLTCALSGWPAVFVSLGGLFGYGLFWGSAGTQGIIWIMAGVLAATILGERPAVLHRPWLMPLIAGCITAISGICFHLWNLSQAGLLLTGFRIAIAALSTALFSIARQRRDSFVDWAVCAVAVLALAQVQPIPYFGFGYIATGFLICTGAFPAAALAGLSLDLAQITPVPMAAAACLGYLSRLIPGRLKSIRWILPAIAYLTVMSLSGHFDLMPLPALLLGGALSYLRREHPSISHRRGDTGVAQVRLEMVSAVLAQTRELLLSCDEGPIDEPALMARAAERACGSCPCRKTCKENAAAIDPGILRKPLGNGAELPLTCRKPGRLLMELRRAQEQWRSIRADRQRQTEYRLAVGQQYAFLSDYLQDLSDSLAKRHTPPVQWFAPEVASVSASRDGISGDRCLWFAGTDCRYYVLLCDGMGTGAEAAGEGRRTGELLRRLLAAGFPPEHAMRSVNSLCALRGKAGIVTMDLAELQLDTGKATLYKWGAAPSYVISRGEPVKVGTATAPPGISVSEGRETVERLSLRRGETLVLLSDGAGGEEALRQVWQRSGEPVGELAAGILESGRSVGTDDATVAVVRLYRTAPGA